MMYEEKREVRLQISQLLADAGINQKSIKEMIEETIADKVDRAFDQMIRQLDSQSTSGSYIKDALNKEITNNYVTDRAIRNAVKDELKNRVISVTLKNIVSEGDDHDGNNH